MRYCVHDGPGIRTAVFLKGCPLHCSWCHNPEGQSKGIELSFREDRCVRCGDCFDLCPNGAVVKEVDGYRLVRETCRVCGTCADSCYAEARELVGREMTVREVLNEILKDLAFFDQSGGGVTFTGGEPLLQTDFLEALLRSCQMHGIHTALETSGFCDWETMERIAAIADLFLYDIKLMDDEAHRRFTGVGNEQILGNLARLSGSGNDVVVRMPVLPGINDHEANLQSILHFLTTRTAVREIHLLPFHRIGRDKSLRLGRQSTVPDLPMVETEQLNAISTLFQQGGLRVTIGG
jgi:pyruvate formate lyase activating enzyme